jgi:ribonuclease HII
VILPKEGDFTTIKDSKKFTSKKKIHDVANYIKEIAIAWSVQYAENDIIDRINIREAVLQTMHKCIDDVMTQVKHELYQREDFLLLIDGNDFRPFFLCDEETMDLTEIEHVTVEKGDGLYSSIAAASILAKVARDDYILELCELHPLLKERYKLDTNMGYGTKDHMEGIKQYGICQWHRKTYGICKTMEQHTL